MLCYYSVTETVLTNLTADDPFFEVSISKKATVQQYVAFGRLNVEV